jgi:hypothetical protein
MTLLTIAYKRVTIGMKISDEIVDVPAGSDRAART